MTTPTTVQARFQLRADTAANWTSVNPILLSNEFGLETDTKKLKVGNGSTAWSSLAYFPSIVSGGTVLGNLEIGTTGTLTFEGSTADGFETTLAVVNPTADRTITLPNQTGTVIVSGNASIVNADISATAEIAVSKLADGAARQLLQTDAAGTGVEWTDNIDIPGTLDVTSTATFDGNVTIAGDLTVNGTTTNINTQNLVVEDKNVILGDIATPTDVTADGGGITLKGTTDKTINWIDATDAWTLSEHVNIASGKEYRINGTKVLDGTSLGSGVTGSSLTSVGTIGTGVWQGTAINKSYLDSTLVSTGDTGTVTSAMIADGTIVDADISASAEIAVSKLADGTARQLLQTDAAGTGVEWASNIDIPGTLDVTSAATFDSSVAVTGALTKSGNNVVTVGDTGTVTSTMIADGTIVDGDINASAAIADTKLATISTAGKVSNSATTATSANTASAIVARDASGNFSAGTITANLSGNASTVTTNANLTGDVTSVGNATSIAAGVIVNADVNASAAIAGTKISPDFGSQNTTTTGTSTAASFIPSSSTAPTNGVYLPAANSVGISTNGSGRLFVDASGNIGINVSAPSTASFGNIFRNKAPVGTGAAGYFSEGANSDTWFGVYSGTGTSDSAALVYPSTGSLRIATSTSVGVGGFSEKIRITSAGLVGIGTSTVSAKLHVKGANGDQAILDNAGEQFTQMSIRNNGTQKASIFYDNTNSTFDLYSEGATKLYANGAEKARITSTGLGIGVTPSEKLHVSGKLLLNNGTDSYFDSASSNGLVITNPTAVRWEVNSSERARIDSSGRLLVGTSSTLAGATDSLLQIRGNSSGSQFAGKVALATDVAATSIVSGTDLGAIYFGNVANGIGGLIECKGDAQWGTNDYPGRLVFSTTADGASSPTERMRVRNDGDILVAKTNVADTVAGFRFHGNATSLGAADFTRDGGRILRINRLTSDGDLIEFAQDNVAEGTISVSGTTVSYNGAHLSRWSQLPGGTERTEIPRGTVLSNIDEMCEWGDEDNEQLNRMKVSDAEGDKNVAGVFQAWDDNDNTYANDFYCAMTGDFVIRIAAGVTVERGDLLMSAGDGTAKPQADDLVRSCTIAKVTSTNVSCTYDDGSYCVPCVLMAC